MAFLEWLIRLCFIRINHVSFTRSNVVYRSIFYGVIINTLRRSEPDGERVSQFRPKQRVHNQYH
ncbi:hypothetical protein EDC53_11271 [Phytobacter diazotrophicus]|nr:hypothetical protein EDC53_11271 [Phytobacter diazotrophicus]